MKTLLIYPPGSYADMPAMGIPCLKAYLRSHGHDHVAAWDANIDFLNWFLASEHIQELGRNLQAASKDPRDGKGAQGLEILWPGVQEEILNLRGTFQDPNRYYQVSTINRAMRAIQLVMSAHNLVYKGVTFHFDQNGFYLYPGPDNAGGRVSVSEVLRLMGSLKPLGAFGRFLQDAVPSHVDCTSDLIGISCANPSQFFTGMLLASELRRRGFLKHIVMGGSFVTTVRDQLAKSPEIFDWIDSIICFEGEDPLLKLIERLDTDSGDLEGIPNLIHRDSHGVCRHKYEKLYDLEGLPTPDFSDFNLTNYWTPEPVLPGFATRGCYYDVCTFCNHHENYFGKFRKRTTANVLQDLKTYKEKYGCTKVFFVDELFIPRQLEELTDGIKDSGLGTKFYCHSRVDLRLTREKLFKMAQGGLTLLHVGMESAATPVLDLMKKGYRREDVLTFLGEVRNVPVTLHLNTIRGFPGERAADYEQTLETVLEFVKFGDYVHLYDFELIDGAPISKGGNPHVENIRPRDPDGLRQGLAWDSTTAISAHADQLRNIDQLRLKLGKALWDITESFPHECCWVMHLLYVARYRSQSEGKSRLDRLRKDTPPENRITELFSDSRLFKNCVFEWEPGAKLYVHDGISYVFVPASIELIQISRDVAASLRSGSSFVLGTRSVSDALRTELYRLCRKGALRPRRDRRGSKRKWVEAA